MVKLGCFRWKRLQIGSKIFDFHRSFWIWDDMLDINWKLYHDGLENVIAENIARFLLRFCKKGLFIKYVRREGSFLCPVSAYTYCFQVQFLLSSDVHREREGQKSQNKQNTGSDVRPHMFLRVISCSSLPTPIQDQTQVHNLLSSVVISSKLPTRYQHQCHLKYSLSAQAVNDACCKSS